MSINRIIFDVGALKMKQERAQKLGYVDFIDKFAISHASEKLSDIRRTFNKTALIGNQASVWAQKLGLKNAKLINESENLNFDNKICFFEK